MASPHQSSETGVWSVEGHSIRVVYWASILEEIRAAAVAGYCKFPRGGLEVGGILFGRLERGATRIVAFRPVPCEYKSGPSYQLSEKDDQVFGEALRAAESDPLLAGLEPVGWYHSHTRSDVCLSEQDLEVHNRHFPKAAQVALVLRPESFGPSRAGFFFREADGKIHAESSYGEFALAARGRKPRGEAKEAKAAENTPAPPEPRTAAAKPERTAPAATPPKATAPARTPRWRRFVWAPVAVLVLTGIAITVTLFTRRGEPAPQSLALSALDLNGQLQIAWDRAAAPVLEAASGSLEIVDGGKKLVLPFNATGLRRGSVTYARSSGNVDVRLTVNPPGRSPVEEMVRFVGAKPADEPKPEVSPPKVEEQPEAPKPKPAQRPPRGKRKVRQRAEVVGPPRRTERARALRLGRPMPRAETRKLGQPPSLVPGAPAIPATAVVSLSREELPAAPALRPASVKSGYRGPASGRMIWTGRLGRGQSLSINGAAASAGYVTGELPGVPVRISAHPADLSDNGLVVYTSRAVAAQSDREAPSPRNGWNLTRYALDPHRAARVLVTEPPSAQTGWRKLTLRGDDAPVAVVVIDWKVAE